MTENNYNGYAKETGREPRSKAPGNPVVPKKAAEPKGTRRDLGDATEITIKEKGGGSRVLTVPKTGGAFE